MNIGIEKGYRPGSIGRVAELHGSYYHRCWGFGLFFEARVAAELAEFLRRYDEARDGFWTVSGEGRIEGSIAIDGLHSEGEGAHLRWFIVSDALRGRGIGNRLISAAIDFCRQCGYKRVHLSTFEGLDAARHLYENTGFKLFEQHRGAQWGTEVNEQRYKEIYQVRIEYPNVVQTFKNAAFPPELVQGLSMALDDFKERPLIVRSSSLLEDRTGAWAKFGLGLLNPDLVIGASDGKPDMDLFAALQPHAGYLLKWSLESLSVR